MMDIDIALRKKTDSDGVSPVTGQLADKPTHRN